MEKQIISLKNGLNIFTLHNGTKDLPPLIFLHGWPSNCFLWRNIIPHLSEHFSVYAPDLPGFGQSTKPLDIAYTMKYYYDFLIEFYEAIGTEKANLVVHDLGAMAGLSLAVQNPQKIDKLIIMNTAPYSNWPLNVRFLISVLKIPQLTFLFLNRFCFRTLLKAGIYDSHCLPPEVVDLYRDQWVNTQKGKRAFSKTIEPPPALMAEPVEKIREIKSETLILWGKNDKLFPFSIAQKLHKDIKGSKLVGIDNAGHFLQEDNPELVRKEIHNFLG